MALAWWRPPVDVEALAQLVGTAQRRYYPVRTSVSLVACHCHWLPPPPSVTGDTGPYTLRNERQPARQAALTAGRGGNFRQPPA
jgi:hypothetical protein